MIHAEGKAIRKYAYEIYLRVHVDQSYSILGFDISFSWSGLNGIQLNSFRGLRDQFNELTTDAFYSVINMSRNL